MTNTNMEPMNRTIVIGNAGHVWVAEQVTKDDMFFHLHNARTIRIWGTSRGLNQLAAEGPSKETVLDAQTDIISLLHHATIALVPCRQGLDWK